MINYTRVSKVRDIKQRIDYLNGKGKEEVLASSSTTDMQLWNELHKQNREAFEKFNSHGSKAKMIDCRQGITPIPYEIFDKIEDYNKFLNDFTLAVKSKFGCEVTAVLHRPDHENDNPHIHWEMSERTLLTEPIKTKEKRATRNRYFDENWKRTTKSKAVHIQKKGDLIEKGKTIYWSDTKNKYFKSRKFVKDLKDFTSEMFETEQLDKNFYFATQHIGLLKNNKPTKKQEDKIRYNKLVANINRYFEDIYNNPKNRDIFQDQNITPKNLFCQNFLKDKNGNWLDNHITTDILEQTFNDFINTCNEAGVYPVQDENISQNNNDELEL